mmetsp:Transcript_13354/g.31612  ORF Transcript_13354/g.31612 Transcript_13354/m.31612 type:complete len:344 (-) Transcript_13354:35-1066(-)
MCFDCRFWAGARSSPFLIHRSGRPRRCWGSRAAAPGSALTDPLLPLSGEPRVTGPNFQVHACFRKRRQPVAAPLRRALGKAEPQAAAGVPPPGRGLVEVVLHAPRRQGGRRVAGAHPRGHAGRLPADAPRAPQDDRPARPQRHHGWPRGRRRRRGRSGRAVEAPARTARHSCLPQLRRPGEAAAGVQVRAGRRRPRLRADRMGAHLRRHLHRAHRQLEVRDDGLPHLGTLLRHDDDRGGRGGGGHEGARGAGRRLLREGDAGALLPGGLQLLKREGPAAVLRRQALVILPAVTPCPGPRAGAAAPHGGGACGFRAAGWSAGSGRVAAPPSPEQKPVGPERQGR